MRVICIDKKNKVLKFFINKKLIFSCACLLGEKVGPKQKEGDLKTPQGKYKIVVKNAKSKYFLSLGINYPNLKDAKNGLDKKIINQKEYQTILSAYKNHQKVPWDTNLGGKIYIHGEGDYHKEYTRGCIKLSNLDMKKLYEIVCVEDTVIIK